MPQGGLGHGPSCASFMKPRRRLFGILAMLSVLCVTQRMLPSYYGVPQSLLVNPVMLVTEHDQGNNGEAQSSGANMAIGESDEIIRHLGNNEKASPSSPASEEAPVRRSTTGARLQEALNSILHHDHTHREMQNNPQDGLATIVSAMRLTQESTGGQGPKAGEDRLADPPVGEATPADQLATVTQGSQPSIASPPQDKAAEAHPEAASPDASQAVSDPVEDALPSLRGPRTVPAPEAIKPTRKLPPPGGKCKKPAPAIRSCIDDFLDAPIALNTSRTTKGVISMSSGGQFGNHAFLIAMAAILSERVGYDVRVQEAWDYFPWTVGKDTTPTTHCTHWTLMNDGNFCDSLHTLADAVQGDGHCIELQDAYLQRFSLFAASMPLVRKVLASPNAAARDTPGEDDLVIHIRFLGPSHKYYGDAKMVSPQDVANADFYAQLDAEYYDKIITSRTYNKVWVVCDHHTREAPLVQHLESKYGVQVHSNRGWWEDYCFLANAKHLVLPISTFSWWAAVLNDATEIHYPLAALWHPTNPHKLEMFQSQLPGSLTVYGPGDDERYVYHDLANRKWFGKYDSCTDTFTYAEGNAEEESEKIGQEQAPVSAEQRLRRRR